MALTALRQATAEQPLPPPSAEAMLAALREARAATFALVDHLSDEQLRAVHSPIMSPLVWDLAHIAAYEDLWISHRHAGMDLLRGELAAIYDAFETPRAVRGEAELLGPRQARDYLEEVRVRTVQALERVGVDDGVLCEMVLRHELQHQETMRQTMALAGLLPPGEPPVQCLPDTDEWIEVPAGPFEMGTGPHGFAYDNERPRHTVELPAFQIARWPVSGAAWLRHGADPTRTHSTGVDPTGTHSTGVDPTGVDPTGGCRTGAGATGVDPDAPVCHVSWFEAYAHARARAARLPSEAEWEKAAALGLLWGVGRVWEWTSSRFEPYPGFVAHPYREYSEVFFGGDYRVLRGGSWASSPRVATVTFRNWDHPFRRQLFAGVRLAREAA